MIYFRHLKFAEQWLPKAKISGPVDDRRLDFFKNALLSSSHIALLNFTGALKFREILRDTIFLICYQVSHACCVTKGMYEIKETSVLVIYILLVLIATIVIENLKSDNLCQTKFKQY